MLENIIGNLLAQLIITVLLSFVIVIVLLRFYFRQIINMSKNLKRPIAFYNPLNLSINNDLDLIERSGLFKMYKPTSDFLVIKNNITKSNILVIVCNNDIFNPVNLKKLDEIIVQISAQQIPLIMLCKERLEPTKLSLIRNQYGNLSLCEYPIRLLSELFVLMSTYSK